MAYRPKHKGSEIPAAVWDFCQTTHKEVVFFTDWMSAEEVVGKDLIQR